MESLAGKTLADYTLTESIGAGTTGEVLKAEDSSGSPRALKVLHQELSLFSRVESYWEEVQLVGTLGHRHIAVADNGDWSKSGRFYLDMPLLDGMDLATALKQSNTLPAVQAVRLVGQACLAMEAVHTEGIVHGALKPTNVFLVRGDKDTTFSSRVLDFATSHLLADETNGDDDVIGMQAAEYLAPEQFEGEATKASDVYALGALLCRCMVGRPPIVGTREEVSQHLENLDLTLPDELSEGMTTLLLKALAKNPNSRYADASELRKALEQWAGTKPEELVVAPVALFAGLPAVEAKKPGPPPKEEAEAGVEEEGAAEDQEVPAPADTEQEAKVETESSEGQEASEAAPEEKELAAIAEEAQTQLTEKKEAAKKKGPPPPKKKRRKLAAAPVESFRDGDGDLVELPVERSVKAFVDGLPEHIDPEDVAPAKTNGNAETIDAAVEQFIDQARAWGASLPPEVTDEAKLAALAKPPVVEKIVEKEVAAAAPLPTPSEDSGGGGNGVIYAAIAAAVSAVLVFGIMKMTTPDVQPCEQGDGVAASAAAVDPAPAAEPAPSAAATEPAPASEPAPAAEPLDEPATAPGDEPTPTSEPLAAEPAPGDEPAAKPADDPAAQPVPAVKKPPVKVAKKKVVKKKRPRKKTTAKKKVTPKKKPAPKKKKKGGSDWVDPFSQ